MKNSMLIDAMLFMSDSEERLVKLNLAGSFQVTDKNMSSLLKATFRFLTHTRNASINHDLRMKASQDSGRKAVKFISSQYITCPCDHSTVILPDRMSRVRVGVKLAGNNLGTRITLAVPVENVHCNQSHSE